MRYWRDVKHERPDMDGKYIVFMQGFYDGTTHIDIVPWMQDLRSFLNKNVTHWMPLPEKPIN